MQGVDHSATPTLEPAGGLRKHRPARAPLRRAAKRMTRGIDEVVEDIFAALRHEVISYGALDGSEAIDQIRADLAHHVVLIVDRVAAGGPLQATELEALASIGERRYALGISHDELVCAYQIGTRVAVGHLLKALEETHVRDPRTIRDATESALRLSIQVTSAISRAYRANQDSRRMAQEKGRVASAIDALVDPATSPGVALSHARELGLGPSDHATIVVAAFVDAGQRAQLDHAWGLAHRLAVALSPLYPKSIVGWRSDHLVCLVPGHADAGRIETAFDGALKVIAEPDCARPIAGAGSTGVGIAALQRSYVEALEMIDVLSATTKLPRSLAFDRSAPFRSFFHDRTLAEQVLGSGIRSLVNEGGELLDTLEAFLDALGNYARAARSLGVSRKTLHRRVRRIEQITGLALDRSRDFMLAQLGVCAAAFSISIEQQAPAAGSCPLPAPSGYWTACSPASRVDTEANETTDIPRRRVRLDS